MLGLQTRVMTNKVLNSAATLSFSSCFLSSFSVPGLNSPISIWPMHSAIQSYVLLVFMRTACKYDCVGVPHSVLENSYANGHKPSNITNASYRWQLLKPLMFHGLSADTEGQHLSRGQVCILYRCVDVNMTEKLSLLTWLQRLIWCCVYTMLNTA